MDLLKREILNEDEFNKANLSIREERAALKAKSTELGRWLNDQGTRASAAERIPAEIKTFLEDFEGLDIRVQKAHL
ncbi:MAG: recombinase family protein, partial [Chloroflexi bacterium]|nr:recombinase family protein [Chloroflexota bacterium]